MILHFFLSYESALEITRWAILFVFIVIRKRTISIPSVVMAIARALAREASGPTTETCILWDIVDWLLGPAAVEVVLAIKFTEEESKGHFVF